MTRLLHLLLALLLCTTCGQAFAGATDPAVLLARLRAVPGVASAEQGTSSIPGTYFYRLTFTQAVDHANPAAGTFPQRFTLLHRDDAAPLVLVTDGYGTSTNATQTELTYYLSANQLRVEHRFFNSSTPASRDWSKLDIRQSSADLHAIRQAFKPLYPAGWVSTGASKSGMTSIYYRYYYPNDVQATVPYVAPSSHGTYDARYATFLSQVGPADCRAAMRAFQVAALQQRDAIVPMIPDSDEYTIFGKDRAFEFAVLETPFAFWQYLDQGVCSQIPGPGATPAQLLAFVNAVVGVDFYSDPVLDYYAPYFYQSATQLGGPAYEEAHIAGLLRYAGQDIPQNYPPLGVPKPFDASIMSAVESWVAQRGRRFVFIYGENDPWSTNAFEPRRHNGSYRFFVRGNGGNHGASLARLPQGERNFILEHLHAWLGSSLRVQAASRKAARTPPPAATLMREDRMLR